MKELRKLVSEDLVPSFETFCKRSAGRIQLMPDVKDCPPHLVEAFTRSIERSLMSHGLLDGALFIGRKDIGRHFYGRALLSRPPRVEELRAAAQRGEAPEKHFFIFGHANEFNAENVAAFRKMGIKIVVSINLLHYLRGDPIADGLRDVTRMLGLGIEGLQIDSDYDKLVFR